MTNFVLADECKNKLNTQQAKHLFYEQEVTCTAFQSYGLFLLRYLEVQKGSFVCLVECVLKLRWVLWLFGGGGLGRQGK